MSRKISIILPTFNRPQFIHRAIQSILDQDYDNWELIIQNGGDNMYTNYSNENLKEKVNFFNEKDTGITDAMNKGMARSTGDIICWCNDDDEMNPGTLKFIDENLTSEWGYGYINMTDGVQSYKWGRPEQGLTLQDLTQGNFVPQPSVFWTRKAYETIGPMDEEQDLTSDYEYWMRLWKNFQPQLFDREMATYHLHPDQITQKDQQNQVNQARLSADKYK